MKRNKETFEERGERFQGFQTVTRRYQLNDGSDPIPLRLKDLRDVVAATQDYPEGAAVTVLLKDGDWTWRHLRNVGVAISNEVPVFAENPHNGAHEGWPD